jgi:hypothetical protein
MDLNSLSHGQVRTGVSTGGCGLTQCSQNYDTAAAKSAGLAFNKLSAGGLCLMFPDAGRGRKRWEASHLAWMSGDFKMFLCEDDISSDLMQSDLAPNEATSQIEAERKSKREEAKESKKRKLMS